MTPIGDVKASTTRSDRPASGTLHCNFTVETNNETVQTQSSYYTDVNDIVIKLNNAVFGAQLKGRSDSVTTSTDRLTQPGRHRLQSADYFLINLN